MSQVDDPKWFYKKVIGFKPKPPKYFGKKKPKRLKPIQGKEAVKDMLYIYEASTDMTEDTASQMEWMYNNLKDLTEEELEELNFKITEIADCTFEDEETNQKIQRLKELTLNEIKMMKSREAKEWMRRQIEGKLARFPQLTKEEVTEEFANSYFPDILNEYQQKLEEGLILPRPEEETPMQFVTTTIKKIMNLRES